MEQTKLQTGTIERNSADAKDRFITFQTKAVDRDKRTIEIVASTINLDRDGEIILPGAFTKTMGKFLGGTSPFLAAHTHRANDATPTQTGWVMTMAILKAIVTAVVRFAKTDVAEQWWLLASDPDGKGIAASIGFIPIRWIYGSAVDIVAEFSELKPILAAAGYKDEDRLRVYTEIELLEISGVPVPSNREAIQILAAKAAGDEGQKALDDFEAQLAAAVARQLEIGNWESAIEAVGEQVSQLRNELRDGISELQELITLSSDTLGLSAPQGMEAPPADVRTHRAGGSEGANGQVVKALQGVIDRLKTTQKT